ncbi:MAG TPA: TIGR00730 family Rossman fold protein [Tepidisphaeraceae bacterium]|nr:TIGR00730 family Rossman fold protein [Tepidisphaeraceae bacterium]
MSRCITVFCASSNEVPQVYHDAARRLGDAIGRNGWTLVYGGGSFGLMGVVSHAACAAGGAVVGIIPKKLVEIEKANEHCTELIVVDDMRARKALLESRCDAFITLPGGIGTFEEFFEMLVGRYLGFHDKPMILVNTNGFFDPLIALFSHGIEQGFINPRARELIFVADAPEQAIAQLGRDK